MRLFPLRAFLAAPRSGGSGNDLRVLIGLTPPRPADRQGALALLVLPALPPEKDPAAPAAAFNPDNLEQFEALARVRALADGARTCRVLFALPLSLVSPRWIAQLAGAGVGTFGLRALPGVFLETDARYARRLIALPHALRRATARVRALLTRFLLARANAGDPAAPAGRRATALLALLGKTLPEGRNPGRAFREIAAAPAPRLERPLPALRVVHLIGSLGPGGAERQLCYQLRGLAARGCTRPTLLSFYPLTGIAGHYLPLLEGADIPRFVLRHPLACADPLFAALPLRLRYGVYAAYRWFLEHPTDVLHAWMDYSAILGGVGALLAGVPRIVLASRNMAPLRFPYLYAHWYRPWYRLLAASDRVFFLNNSRAGAADYTRWLGLAPGRFTVTPNAVDNDLPLPPPEAVAALRRELGIDAATPLVAGVFRLSAEKRPEAFAAVLGQLLRRRPGVRAVHAGIGPLEAAFRAALEREGIADRVALLGRREDVATILGAATALLLTSTREGMPNVLLEAQRSGCPVVAARAGGAPDCLLPGVTGFLHDPDDLAGMAASLGLLVGDAARRDAMGQAGMRFMREQFALDGMLDRMAAFYGRVAATPCAGDTTTVGAIRT